jgi:hypothetical protein
MSYTRADERVQIEWRWPLSGIHSLIMVNSAQPGEGKGCRLGCSDFAVFLTPKGPKDFEMAKKNFQLQPWHAKFFGKNRKKIFFIISKFNFRNPF